MAAAATAHVAMLAELSTTKITQAQKHDHDLSVVLTWCENNRFHEPSPTQLTGVSREVRHFAGEAASLVLVNDLLCRRSPAGDLQLVVPVGLRQAAVSSVHALPGGHQGVDKTYSKCAQRFTGLAFPPL